MRHIISTRPLDDILVCGRFDRPHIFFHEGSNSIPNVIIETSEKCLGNSLGNSISAEGTDLANRAEPGLAVLPRKVAATVISTLLDGVSVAEELGEAVALRTDDGSAEVRSGSLRRPPLREHIRGKRVDEQILSSEKRTTTTMNLALGNGGDLIMRLKREYNQVLATS